MRPSGLTGNLNHHLERPKVERHHGSCEGPASSSDCRVNWTGFSSVTDIVSPWRAATAIEEQFVNGEFDVDGKIRRGCRVDLQLSLPILRGHPK
jgi:hypothetical protein